MTANVSVYFPTFFVTKSGSAGELKRGHIYMFVNIRFLLLRFDHKSEVYPGAQIDYYSS